MFNSVGLRQRNMQRMRLAANKDGKLLALAHQTTTHYAISDGKFVEPCGDCSKIMYATPNSLISYASFDEHYYAYHTRGPGKSTGSFALESAIDELLLS